VGYSLPRPTILYEGETKLNLLEAARLWYDAGYMVVPTHTDGTKRPFGFWRNYQDIENRPDFEHIERLIEQSDSGGIGVITGKASGNVEMLELEGRAASMLKDLDTFADQIGIGHLWKRMREGCVEFSPSGGIHFFVRVTDGEVDGNTPLAERPNPDNASLVERLAETRGEGGFVVVAPSAPRKSQDGKPYRFIKADGDLLTPDRTPNFTKAELTEVHRVFRSLDERRHDIETTPVQIEGTRPGDDFANQTDWAEILEPHGWQRVYESRENTYWRRPGKKEGISASTKNGWFYVFTTSTSFEANRAYGKFFVYAKLNHNGDVTAAAKDLRAKGYGEQSQSPTSIEKQPTQATKRIGTIVATPLSQIEPQPTDWLWNGRMALGAFNLLAGREGLGKSTVAYWAAAEVTHGRLDGHFFGKPKSVIIAATEDSFPKTIVPRLLAAGANLDRIFRVDVAETDGVLRELLLPLDINGLGAAVTENDAALVILDPLMSRISGAIDTHKDADVRQALEPITRICEQTNATLLGVIHHNKMATDDPNSAVMGSRAFTAVARAVHSVVSDPEDEVGARKIFETTKNNLGRLDLAALAFTIEGVDIPTRAGRPAKAGALVWGGESDLRARDAMRMVGRPSTKTKECKDWLRGFITQSGGVASKGQVMGAAKEVGYSERTVERASKDLQIVKRKDGSGGVWELS
jgi:hypothetical protein